MEYGPEISIFGLKLMMKSGLEKIFLKFLHAQRLFQKVFFITEFALLSTNPPLYEVNQLI